MNEYYVSIIMPDCDSYSFTVRADNLSSALVTVFIDNPELANATQAIVKQVEEDEG